MQLSIAFGRIGRLPTLCRTGIDAGMCEVQPVVLGIEGKAAPFVGAST